MPRATDRTVLQRFQRSLRSRLAKGGDDAGFMLVEVMIALSLITVIMAAVGVEFVSGLANTAHQRALANATQTASTAVNDIRALDPSDLLTGRTQAAVTTERSTLLANPRTASWVSSAADRLAFNDYNSASYAASPDNGGTSTTGKVSVAVPTVASAAKPGTVSYKVYKYIECSVSSPLVANPIVNSTDPQTYQRNCSPIARTTVSGSAQAGYMRVVVAVIWTDRGCPSTGCAFVTSTQIDGHANPTFDLNQALPPAPIENNPGVQTWSPNTAVSLQLTVQDGTGVAPFSWSIASGSLPAGLSLSPAGLISGTPSATATKTTGTVTVQVTDAFIRTAENPPAISYTVYPQLKFTAVGGTSVVDGDTNPTMVSNKTTDNVSTSVTATGGSASGYVFTVSSGALPTGLVLASNGAITGRPTTAGTYSVTFSVKDSANITAAVSASWTIMVPPMSVTNPGTLTATINQQVSAVQLSATGGSGTYTFTATSLPDGLSMTTAGRITGSPSKTGSYNVGITVTDTSSPAKTASTSFTWTVAARPTLASIADQSDTQGAAVSVATSGTCNNGACTYSLSGQPANVTIDPSSGIISGTLATTATTKTGVQVTVTDSAGATASRTFTWTLLASPTVSTGVSSVITAVNASPNIPISWTCANAPCVLKVGSAVPGLGLSTSPTSASNLTSSTSLTLAGTSGTAYLTGKVQDSATGTSQTSTTAYSTVLTLTDSDSIADTETDSWTARRQPYTTWPGAVTLARNATVAQSYDAACNTSASSCQIALTGAPTGVGLSSTTQTTAQTTTSGTLGTGSHYVTGRVASNAATGSYTLTLTVTQTVSGTTTSVSSVGIWTVT